MIDTLSQDEEKNLCAICYVKREQMEICGDCLNKFCRECVQVWKTKLNMCPYRCQQTWNIIPLQTETKAIQPAYQNSKSTSANSNSNNNNTNNKNDLNNNSDIILFENTEQPMQENDINIILFEEGNNNNTQALSRQRYRSVVRQINPTDNHRQQRNSVTLFDRQFQNQQELQQTYNNEQNIVRQKKNSQGCQCTIF